MVSKFVRLFCCLELMKVIERQGNRKWWIKKEADKNVAKEKDVENKGNIENKVSRKSSEEKMKYLLFNAFISLPNVIQGQVVKRV